MNIVKILVILVLIYVGYKIVTIIRRVKFQEVKGCQVNPASLKGEDLVQDPLCKTYIAKSQAYTKEIEGRQLFFCSLGCCEKYLSDKK
jgi:YHS domain-containing protein